MSPLRRLRHHSQFITIIVVVLALVVAATAFQAEQTHLCVQSSPVKLNENAWRPRFD